MLSRNRILPLLLIITLLIVWKINEEGDSKMVALNGATMGTGYQVKYLDPEGLIYQTEIDSILEDLNQSLSTYLTESEISRFNRELKVEFAYDYFPTVLEQSRQIFQKTNGAFNPAVMPLVNAWGFGPEGRQSPDSAEVDSLLSLVDFEDIQFDSLAVWKTKEGVQLDFSAIAKGYGVDVIANFLTGKGLENYLVEIGGELICRGNNDKGELWRIGINTPIEFAPADSRVVTVKLQNRALATSGNYRNYYVKDGQKYAHTIDPKTGFPVQHSLLSASVFSNDCITADAYATAFMVMGLEDSKDLIARSPDLEAIFVYEDKEGNMSTFISPGLEGFILQ